MPLSFPIRLVNAAAGEAAVVILPDAALHAAALSAVYALYQVAGGGVPISGMTTEPTPELCGPVGTIPRRLLDHQGKWRESPAAAVEQIVEARCVHIVFEPLMPSAYLGELVRRACNAANRIVVFCTLEDFGSSSLPRMDDVKVFGFLNPIQ